MNFGFRLLILATLPLYAATVSLTGTVVDEQKHPLVLSAVSLHMGNPLLAHTRTLTNEQGLFSLNATNAPELDLSSAVLKPIRPIMEPWSLQIPQAAPVTLVASDLQGRSVARLTLNASAGIHVVQQPAGLLNGLSSGLYAITAHQGSFKQALGLLYHQGLSTSASPSLLPKTPSQALARSTLQGQKVFLVLKKAGYLAKEIEIDSYSANLGTITLTRDPLESRIDSVMALMTLKQKLAQMVQPLSIEGSTHYSYGLYGSTLDGGDRVNTSFMNAMVQSVNNWTQGAKIPVTYGKDAVHGHAGMVGATVFPHNIGLGASRDSALVRRIGEATAKELWATGVDLNFSPAISVPRDERWGRTYEGFGETPELAVQMGAAMVRGLQGDHYNAPWRVIATAKHFLADGATNNGKDRANATLTDAEIRTIHLPGYEAVVNQGVLSVMASFNSINNIHQHIDSLRVTGILKNRLGFDGYVISDWSGIGNSNDPGATGDYSGTSGQGGVLTQESVRKAIQAGVDLAMEPGTHGEFLSYLNNLVQSGAISQARIDDAVRRILRAKFRAGRMDQVAGPAAYRNAQPSWLGHSDHHALAREAVRKSLVLLKNNQALPLSKTAKIYVTGSHANNAGYQCGGWTLDWQGSGDHRIQNSTTILEGIRTVAPSANLVYNANDADIIIYATGEEPYAEWKGDNTSLNLPLHTQQSNLVSWKAAGKTIVTLLISGRPLPVTPLIEASDAFIAAWLPGSAGIGIADVLFGDYAPTGKLPHTWPAQLSDIPINEGDGKTGLYPYGHGLTYP